jgi:prepilin-type N-terminal cleavage/methylation domain-containing protein
MKCFEESRQHDRDVRQLRRGLTLVELLMVIAIIVTLAAVVLPSVKELLKDQKITQAARQVQSYFETARARAMATGRPVGVLIDRLSYVNAAAGGTLVTSSTSLRMSIVEVMPPYAGDIQGATAKLINNATPPGSFVNVALLPTSTCATASAIVTAGDLITFGDNPIPLAITGVGSYTDGGGVMYTTLSLANPPPSQVEPIWMLNGPPLDLPFKIYRKPGKALSSGVDLPRGICLDLSASGIGPTGRQFSPDVVAGDMGWTGVAPGDFRGIYIVFDPNGGVQRIYQGMLVGSVVQLGTYLPSSTIHLLLGKTDQVLPPTLISPFDGTTILQGSDVATANLMDPENVWVSINPFTGSIYSSVVAAPAVPANPSLFNVATRTLQARQFAIQGVAREGR